MVILIGFYLPKISCPFIKMIYTQLFQHICLQIAHKGVKLGHTVADRRAHTHRLSTTLSQNRRRRNSPLRRSNIKN